MTPRAFITGLSGQTLTRDEMAFLREAKPWGAIVFKRNIRDRKQLAEFTKSIREGLGRDAPILVDQEGGRVQRLEPPHWQAYPPGQAYGVSYDRDAAQGLAGAELGARLIASDLAEVGLDVDCLPIADVPVAGSNPIIGDRAYGHHPGKVAAISAAIARGLMRGGVLPVLKHLPGHGRATADSHLQLPTVDTARSELELTDFAAFRPLAALPIGMTAHVVFSSIDPAAPATTSATMVSEVIRDFIGFQGLLMSDDVSMEALSGSLAERSRAALAAGCDVVLHCNGNLAEMQAVAAEAPLLTAMAAKRADAALAMRRRPDEFDAKAARATFAAMMTGGKTQVAGL